jgi:hypothetical protein
MQTPTTWPFTPKGEVVVVPLLGMTTLIAYTEAAKRWLHAHTTVPYDAGFGFKFPPDGAAVSEVVTALRRNGFTVDQHLKLGD